MREYQLYVNPNDESPYLTVPESAVSYVPTGKPETIDITSSGEWGSLILRFRPLSPTSHKAYLVAMEGDFYDGFVSRYSRSLG